MRLVSSSTLVPVAHPPKKLTTPPRRTMSTAHCQVCGRPTASITISDPRPSVTPITASIGLSTLVICTTSSAARCLADDVVQITKVESPIDAVIGVTEGRGSDIVIEAVGRPQTWQWAVDMVRRGGVVNFFGG